MSTKATAPALMDGGFLDFIEGESRASGGDEAATELLYRPAENIFGAVADDMVGLGWSIFPQDEQRRPGRVNNGDAINWQSKHKLSERRPNAQELQLWKAHCASLNVACVMGPGSGNVFALDIDVLDEDLSRQIVDLADEMLGYTPFRRIGNAPKIALIYRAPEGDAIDSISRRFVDYDENGDPVASEHLIDVLGKGKLLTFHGKHHKTGRYFRWLDISPLSAGPDAAPVVSSVRLVEFLERLDSDIRRFHRGAAFKLDPTSWEWDEDRKVLRPGRLASANGLAPWVENDEGLVVDGRESYLSQLTFEMARLNPGLPAEQLASLVVEQFAATAEVSGRWHGQNLLREALGKARHLIRRVEAGELSFKRPRATSDAGSRAAGVGEVPEISLPVEEDHLRAAGLDFLIGRKRRPFRGVLSDEKVDVEIDEETRMREVSKVQEDIQSGLQEFFGEVIQSVRAQLRASGTAPPPLAGADAAVFPHCDDEPVEPRVHIFKAPTGAGKTSHTIRFIARHRKALFPGRDTGEKDDLGLPIEEPLETYEDAQGIERNGTRPIVFLLPTYANIEELQKRVQGLNLGGSKEEIEKAARDLGLIPEDQLEARLADLQREAMNAGLRSMVFRGKVAAGCQIKDKIAVAQEAGINSSSLCRATKKLPDGTTEEIFCEFYHSCPAITQKNSIQQSHVVFMPHAFMNLDLPHELKEVKAVIADERVHHLFLHTTTFPLASLMIPRKPPRLSRRERDENVDVNAIMQERKDAVEIVLDALKRDICPAQALFEVKDRRGRGQGAYGFTIVRSSLRVCGGGMKRDVSITPHTTLDELKEICAKPAGVDISEEYRFWRIIEERMQQLAHDDLIAGEIRKTEDELEGFQGDQDPDRRHQLETRLARLRAIRRRACGKKDMRIQFLRDHEGAHVRELVRISWRTEPNWVGLPMLLLDASAAPEIISKIWNSAATKVHEIASPLHVRVVGVVDKTYSNASLIGTPGAPRDQQALAARRLNQVRRALSAVSGYFGWGRVVAGASIVVRRAINANWEGPINTDWCHYGAMRGLDFAKHHAAAFSVGRMEVPVRSIDGLVAALTYDDDEPELPFDRNGTGRVDGDKPLMLPMGMQRLRMRTGKVVEIPTPMYPGKWGRLMQRQYREEELNQFVGRLRPVYREGEAPVWFAFSSVLPEDLIIDDLITIDDLVPTRVRIWDATRRAGGVVEPAIFAQCCPELFGQAEEAADYIQSEGFDLEEGSVTHRNTWGFVSLRWRATKRDKWRFAYALAAHEDPESALADALERHLGVQNAEVVIASQGRGRTQARPREPDKIDLELGDREVRRERELHVMEEAAVQVFEEGAVRLSERSRSKKRYPAIFSMFSKSARAEMTYADVEAMVSLDRLWERLRHEKNQAESSAFTQDRSETYEGMADHVSDQDSGAEETIGF